MQAGILCFLTGYSITPAELARTAEDAGFESVWTGDHSHVPLGPDGQAAVDTRSGRPVPVHYAQLLDPFVALSQAAAVTSRIRVGTGICLVTQRDVISTAKSVASLDHLSGGRFLFGVGAGWNHREMTDHGTDPRTRRTRLRESLEAMKVIWTNEVAEYKGSTVSFGPMRCGPQVQQRPHPPIFLGGDGRNLDRVVEYADGWIPSTTVDPGREFLRHIPELQRKALAAGRARIAVTSIHVTDVEALEEDGAGQFGEDDWSVFEAAGVDRVVLIVPPGRDGALRQIERYARFTGR
jgi:probable F420-dependent oxidoreductase